MVAKGIDLSGKVALITAGASGIGAAAAEALASYGADVVIGDIAVEKGEATIARIEAQGGRGLFVEMDALQTAQIEAMVARAADRFGRIDILINNAGGVTKRLFMDSFERSWRKHIDMNLISMMAATLAAVPVMIAGGRGGAIINVSSVEGLRGAPGVAVYAACKAGMINFTQSLAAELAGDGIRVNALAPDMVRSDGMLGFNADTPEMQAARARYIPLGRIGEPPEYGHLVAFLCSDLASYLTGTMMRVDGGSLAASGFTRSPETGEWGLLHV